MRQTAKKYASSKNSDLKNIIAALNRVEPTPVELEKNITQNERQALEELKELSNTAIEIKKADKSDLWVIMDKDEYRDKLVLKEHLQTNTYERATEDANEKVYTELSKLVQKNSKCLTKGEKNFILAEDWKVAYFYTLPKINKCQEIIAKIGDGGEVYVEMKMPKTLKSRPICGGPRAVTQGASKLLDKILSPLVPEMKSYIRDEWDFVRRFPKKINGNYKLFSCDIVALYPSIPTELGLQALDYWIDKLRHKINGRFSKPFILELAEFVLRNNYFEFDGKVYHQVIGTSMGSIFAPPYSQLTIGFLEETKLYPILLPSKFDRETCLKIIEFFFRFMDDGTTLIPEEVDEDLILELLNSMHPAIRYTLEKAKRIFVDGKLAWMLVFLSLIIYLGDDGEIWTDVFYKQTNTHQYLNYRSHHPEHIKKNIPHALAKRILVLTSKESTMEKNLEDLKIWLRECGYPDKVIDRGIHTASLQGPAPEKQGKVIPLINTFYSNYSHEHLITVAKQLIGTSSDPRVKKAFENVQFVQAFKQPPNLLRTLSNSKFIQPSAEEKPRGTYKCSNSKCKICRLYLQEEASITMANGTIWEIRSRPNCHSMNIIYYLVCSFCGGSSIGKTDHCRDRTNNHISDCRHGTGADFDKHVFACGKLGLIPDIEERNKLEPFFKLHIMLECNDYQRLLGYEKKFQNAGMDTMNRPC